MNGTTIVSWVWWAPLGAAALHIGEEFVYPGSFASWDRGYRPAIKSSIMPGLHLVVNGLLLAACAWLTLAALLFSNAVFHLVGTFQTKRLSPGVRTGGVRDGVKCEPAAADAER